MRCNEQRYLQFAFRALNMFSLASFVWLVATVAVNEGINIAEDVTNRTFGFVEKNVPPSIDDIAQNYLLPVYSTKLVAEGLCSLAPQKPCKESKYRTVDGHCNNLKNPNWGTPNSRFQRLLPPKYADGVYAPPVSVTGSDLPPSRLLSFRVFPDKNVADPIWTLNAMQWGQLIAHDMSLASGTAQSGEHPINCCTSLTANIPYGKANARCFPIIIPNDDPFYSKFNQTCMNFVRTITDVIAGCPTPKRFAEQVSSVTAFMDASLVYGSVTDVSLELREGQGGKLRVDSVSGRSFPPPAQNKSASCNIKSEDEPCYQFGDVRGNQSPDLSVLQLVLLREHNRLAGAFKNLNPHWDDETLYQEARRVLIAEYQNINYYEWLPIFLGSENMKKNRLFFPEALGYIEDYKEDVQPVITNSYTTAAFRFFHSGIQGQLQLVKENRKILKSLCLSDYFDRPFIIQEGSNFDNLARGLSTQHQQTEDQYFTNEVTNYFLKNGKLFGQDLMAIGIQRGRDHGLASYNDFRKFCGLPKASKFEEFNDHIADKNIELLKSLYAHPDDVDLVVGGSLERLADNALVGPTYLCIIIEQFYRTRVGDRFFFERSQANPGAFTPEQLKEIRKSTVSRLMCDNGDNLRSMQRSGFKVISESNPVISCKDTNAIPTIDLSLWKEENPANQ